MGVTPTGPSDNPFEGLPFFGDISKLLGKGGGVPWDAARSLALAVATDGQSEPNVDPMERMKLEQLARVAELHVANVTGLSTTVGGREVTLLPVNRGTWAARSLEAFRPLLEKLAGSLSHKPKPGEPTAPENDPLLVEAGIDPEDPFAGMVRPMLEALQPTMVAMTAGSMVGHLARRSFGQYDQPIPRPKSDELMILVPNLDEFGEEWSLPPDDFKLWICIHEIAHHAILGVPHVRSRLQRMLDEFATSFSTDPHSLEDRLMNIGDAQGDLHKQMQAVLSDPGALLGAIESEEQRRLRPQIDALLAVEVGVVDHVMDQVGSKLIGSYGMLSEALRRQRVETSEADRFVERMLGLELTQAVYDRGAAFVEGVVERAGKEGLARLWESERMLPSPPEVDAPGLWLARIDLPADDD